MESATDSLIARNLPGWVELLGALVRCPSTFEHEHDAVDVIERRLRAASFTPLSVPFDAALLRNLGGAQPPFSEVPGRRNLVVRLDGQQPGRSIIVNSQLDIVGAGDEREWRWPPFSGHVEDGVMYGRGVHDGKAGAVLAVALLEILRALNLPRRGSVLAQFVLEDENTGNGSLLCLHQGFVGDAAIILDGTRGDTGINAHAGQVQFGLKLRGKPVSISVSHVGINAAEMLARLLLDLRETVFGWNRTNQAPWSRFPSPNQFAIHTLASTGEQLTLPEWAEGTAYLTFTPPLSVAAVRSQLEDVAARFSERHQLPEPPRFDWSYFASEPVESASHEIESVIRSAARRVGHGDVAFGPSTGISDMRHFVARNIPCVLFGPGKGFNPHRPNERYDLASIPPMLRTLVGIVQEWCE